MIEKSKVTEGSTCNNVSLNATSRCIFTRARELTVNGNTCTAVIRCCKSFKSTPLSTPPLGLHEVLSKRVRSGFQAFEASRSRA